MSSLYFSVKVQKLTRIIEINEADLVPGECEKVFFTKVFSVFQIQNKEELCVKLLNQDNAPIPDGKLSHIMLQYKNCSHFSIRVVFPDGFATTFMKMMLYEYLKERKCDNMFIEEETLGCLSKVSSKQLAQNITSFIEETYSLKASKEDIFEVCRAAIVLFPSLETKPSHLNGIDALYNEDSHSGLVFECIKYRSRKQSKQKKVVQPQPRTETDLEMDDLILFFDSCVLPRDTQKLKAKLSETADTRRDLLAQDQRSFPKMLNFYRVDLNLLLYDFTTLYPTIDEQALLKAWDKIKKKPLELFQIKLDDKDDIFQCDVEVYRFFTFLKLFQPHKVKLITAAQSFMVFTKEATIEPNNLVNKKNVFPHIIFIKAGDETKFYIHIFCRLLSVPKELSFIQVLDMFIKVHKIFQTPFHNHLQQVMNGFCSFVYRFDGDEKNLTPKSLLCKSVFDFDSTIN